MFERYLINLWNRRLTGKEGEDSRDSLYMGRYLRDGLPTANRASLTDRERVRHVAVVGITGTGKSTVLRYLASQDIKRSIGHVTLDLHGDSIPKLLSRIAEQERRTGQDLSSRTILIRPHDPENSVGLNLLKGTAGRHNFLLIAEFAQILKVRWGLTTFGARTEELLRNGLFVLADNNLTLLELSLLLTNYPFRVCCLQRVTNPEVREYFQSRFDRASDAMQGVMRDPILNKTSAFCSDPNFRHILGQRHSTFNLTEAIDQGFWIYLDLEKGRLGEQAATLGSLFLTKLKNALFARRERTLFTLYADEIQNLVVFDTGLDSLLSEARKFGVSVVTANQFLDQFSPAMRSAVLSVGSHVFFQLSAPDAEKVASHLDGGRMLRERLKNLPQRHFVLKTGSDRPQEVRAPFVREQQSDISDLLRRINSRWARPRREVEREIRERQTEFSRGQDEVLHDWD